MSLENENKNENIIWILLRILSLILVFFLALNIMSGSLRLLGTDAIQTFFQAAHNPFIGLFIGLLVTAIIQSSSTTTSATVALVANGALNYDTAIPIIMGANIGTTITTTLVSLAFIGQKTKFQRALSTALSHNFFNVMLVLLLFPLEYYYGLLSITAQSITGSFSETLINPNSPENYTSNGFTISGFIIGVIQNGFISLFVSFILLVVSIKFLAKSIYELLVASRSSDFTSFFNNPYQSFSFGLLLTAGVQSSSVTTSFAVPVATTGEIPVKNIFPFILGANIGTTITAFFATLINSEAALVIALAHLLFNLIGVAIFLPFKALRNIPINLATGFSNITLRYRIVGFIYLLVIFFILPFTLIYFNRGI